MTTLFGSPLGKSCQFGYDATNPLTEVQVGPRPVRNGVKLSPVAHLYSAVSMGHNPVFMVA